MISKDQTARPPLFLQAENVAVQLSQFVRLDLFVGSVGDCDVLQLGRQTRTVIRETCG